VTMEWGKCLSALAVVSAFGSLAAFVRMKNEGPWSVRCIGHGICGDKLNISSQVCGEIPFLAAIVFPRRLG
jgi:hypothetical protein